MKKSVITAALVTAAGLGFGISENEILANDDKPVVQVENDAANSQTSNQQAAADQPGQTTNQKNTDNAAPSETESADSGISGTAGTTAGESSSSQQGTVEAESEEIKDGSVSNGGDTSNGGSETDGSDGKDTLAELDNKPAKVPTINNGEDLILDPAQTVTTLEDNKLVQNIGWNSDKTSYTKEDGELATGIYSIGSDLYYFDQTGKIQYGQQKADQGWICADKKTGILFTGLTELGTDYQPSGAKTVYYDKNGIMQYGMIDCVLNDGQTRFFDLFNGAMYVDRKFANKGKNYYATSNGVIAKGEVQENGKWMLFDKTTGEQLYGFQNITKADYPDSKEEKYVYYGTDGYQVRGQYKVGEGKWICADLNTGNLFKGYTHLTTEYQPTGDKWVLYGQDGLMQYGRHDDGHGNMRYFDTVSGKMMTNYKGKDGDYYYYFDKDGIQTYGEIQENGKWMLFDRTTGRQLFGFQTILKKDYPSTDEDKKVYYDKDGYMVKGQYKVDEWKWICADKFNGKLFTGLTYLDGSYEGTGPKWVLYGKDGLMLYGRQRDDKGNLRYFHPVSGKMMTNYRGQVGTDYYYFDKDGIQTYGEIQENGKWMLFDKDTGKQLFGFQIILKKDYPKTDEDKKVYYDKDGYMVKGQYKVGEGKWICADKFNGKLFFGLTHLTKEYQSNGDKWVYYDDDGFMHYGFLTDSEGNVRFCNKVTGELLRNEFGEDNGKYYYFDNSGKQYKGEIKVNGYWYLLDLEDGHRVTGFTTLKATDFPGVSKDKEVFYDSQGRMVYGEQKINNNVYYFLPEDGTMIRDKEVYIKKEYSTNDQNKTCYFKPDGTRFEGERKLADGRVFYYKDKTGAKVSVYVKDLGDNNRIAYGSNGWRAYEIQGQDPVNGKWYFFGKEKDGGYAVKNALISLSAAQNNGSAKTVYYDKDGAMFYGMKQVAGGWKYFKPGTGAMTTNEFITIEGSINYFNGKTQKSVFNQYGNLVLDPTFTLDGVRYSIDTKTGEAKRSFPSWCTFDGDNIIFAPHGHRYVFNRYSRIGKLLAAAAPLYDTVVFQSGGRNNDEALDCVGFVMHCYNEAYHTDRLQASSANDFYHKYSAYEIPVWQAQPGDIIQFRGTWTPNTNIVTHTSIYLGGGQVLYLTYTGCTIGPKDGIQHNSGQFMAPQLCLRLPWFN